MMRVSVLDMPVDAVDMEGALNEVDRLVRTADRANYIIAVNPEKVYAVRENAFLEDFWRHAALAIPDGIGMVIAIQWLYKKHVARVAGADLMQAICAASPRKGYRIFIYGASEEVNAGAVQELKLRNPGIRIVGRANGFVRETEMKALVQQINEYQPDILFVALGSPKQEQWLQRWLPELNVKVCQGIGGTLDTIVGRVKRAPLSWQKMGLEWLYRLLHEPSRIWRQLNLIRFGWEVLMASVSIHRFSRFHR
jgi:N-acetylglucosaminyldiphosphoundecaprenol N-acetyl-beta-D-mannosaminyltransferase